LSNGGFDGVQGILQGSNDIFPKIARHRENHDGITDREVPVFGNVYLNIQNPRLISFFREDLLEPLVIHGNPKAADGSAVSGGGSNDTQVAENHSGVVEFRMRSKAFNDICGFHLSSLKG
jgi:hypothetical protein